MPLININAKFSFYIFLEALYEILHPAFICLSAPSVPTKLAGAEAVNNKYAFGTEKKNFLLI
jgi:hypothetical protein